MRAEYVAAGPDLALVRVEAEVEELLVFAGGRVQTFEPLPGAPGDAHTGFPVPLDLVTAGGSEFRVVAGGREMGLDAVDEAPAKPRRPAVDPELTAAREELERVRGELDQRVTANSWLERESESARERAAKMEAELAELRPVTDEARARAEAALASEREAVARAERAIAESDATRADAKRARADVAAARKEFDAARRGAEEEARAALTALEAARQELREREA